MFKMNLSYVFVLALVLFTSCKEETPELQQDSSFAEMSVEILATLSETYPSEDLTMTMSINNDGNEQAVYSLIGESQKYAQLGTFVRLLEPNSENEGTDCTGGVSCGKAINECLDGGRDALISKGACATYCVTCQDSQ